jgi:hypothetical protein
MAAITGSQHFRHRQIAMATGSLVFKTLIINNRWTTTITFSSSSSSNGDLKGRIPGGLKTLQAAEDSGRLL